MGPAIDGLTLKQAGIALQDIGTFQSLRKRNLGSPPFDAYRQLISAQALAVTLVVESGSLKEPPAFFGMFYWTTAQGVQRMRVRPPQNAPSYRIWSFAIQTDVLSRTGGTEAFDEAVSTLVGDLGVGHAGLLLDRPWHFDQEVGIGGVSWLGHNLLARSPYRNDAHDIDTWSPGFDIPLGVLDVPGMADSLPG
jgi:hypothetical protein